MAGIFLIVKEKWSMKNEDVKGAILLDCFSKQRGWFKATRNSILLVVGPLTEAPPPAHHHLDYLSHSTFTLGDLLEKIIFIIEANSFFRPHLKG